MARRICGARAALACWMPEEACSIHGARLAQGAAKLPKYSERLAIKGSTRVALSAGKQVARTAVSVTTAVAAISVMGASSTLYLSSRNILRDMRLSESLRAKSVTTPSTSTIRDSFLMTEGGALEADCALGAGGLGESCATAVQ